MYTTLVEDELFTSKVQSQPLFFKWCEENEDKTLEEIVSSFCSKELKESQKRFLALEIEKKLVTKYITKLNTIIYDAPKTTFHALL